MKEQYRFVNELVRIVNGALRLDIDKVRNYTAYLADRFESEGDVTVANRIRSVLADADRQLRPADSSFSKAIPVDAESRFPLIERVRLNANPEPPVLLPQDHWDIVNEFLSIAKSYAQLDTQDTANSLSLLMYGPPGTGKSRLARHIAQELGVDLYMARLDGLISSFLGSTSKNIRALFDFAAKTPCILFLDEFDAIAKLRGDSQELGELKRVVNSFLQNFDTLGKQSIILAATNHEGLLDAAVWRRFTYRVELRPPNSAMRKQMWTTFIEPVKFKDRDVDLFVDLSEGFSGSDIREVCLRVRRNEIVGRRPHQLKDAFQIIKNIAIGDGEEKRFASSLKSTDTGESIRKLRQRNPRLYSFSALADLFGVSKATVYRLSSLRGTRKNAK